MVQSENSKMVKKPSKIEKIAEILSLMEETQKNKEWLIRHLKKLKIRAKHSMNSFQILNLCPETAINDVLKILKGQDLDDIGDINDFTKSYHWFFTDIVAGSNPTIPSKEQARKVIVLNELIRRTEVFKNRNQETTIILPTGDGMAIGFAESPEQPLRLSIQLHRLLNQYNKPKRGKEKVLLRIGMDIGPVYIIKDLTDKDNVWGPGIILTRRVMDLAGDMNIFASRRFADDVRVLSPEYKEILHGVGNYTIKHGEELEIFNVYGEGFGNKQAPRKSKIMLKQLSFEDELKAKTTFQFYKIEIDLDVINLKTMLTHHVWDWNLINISKEPRDMIFYYLDGDVPRDFKDLNIKVTDEDGNSLNVLSVEENKPTHKEFTVKMKKPIRPRQRNRHIKLEYDWEEPEGNYFYKMPTDCKNFKFNFSIPSSKDVKARVLKIDTELGYKWIANPPPSVKYNKKTTVISWEGKNLKAYDAYKFEW